MSEYKIYSIDVWDYLNDMPYMPSRNDRDRLIQKGDLKRVHIWDYFFRIKPQDLGKPQKKEISEIEIRLSEMINIYNERKKNINKEIREAKISHFWKKLWAFLYGVGGFLAAYIVYRAFYDIRVPFAWMTICFWPLMILGSIMWASIVYLRLDEYRDIQKLSFELEELSANHEENVKKELERKNVLRGMIKFLQRQIPEYIDGSEIYRWVFEDFRNLWKRSQEVTALGDELVKIASGNDNIKNIYSVGNPIQILGPAELQHAEKIPPFLKRDINLDLSKHLSARRSHKIENGTINVFYGVYYLEHLLIAEDMLATYGLFFDFITGKFYMEQMTEQYYKDVVAVQIKNEFRHLNLDSEKSGGCCIY